jgi:hypothetical protein
MNQRPQARRARAESNRDCNAPGKRGPHAQAFAEVTKKFSDIDFNALLVSCIHALPNLWAEAEQRGGELAGEANGPAQAEQKKVTCSGGSMACPAREKLMCVREG